MSLTPAKLAPLLFAHVSSADPELAEVETAIGQVKAGGAYLYVLMQEVAKQCSAVNQDEEFIQQTWSDIITVIRTSQVLNEAQHPWIALLNDKKYQTIKRPNRPIQPQPNRQIEEKK